MSRTLLAVAAGFVLWTVLWLAANTILQNAFPQLYAPSGRATPVLLLALISISAVLSLIGGYTTASVAVQERERHALYLGILLLLVGLFVQIQNWYLAPTWYHVLFLALLVPASMLGGYSRVMR